MNTDTQYPGRYLVPFGALLLILSLARGASADDAFTKLGRGVTNAAFGWGELIRQTEAAWKEKGVVQGYFTAFFRGGYCMFRRTFTGFYEILTFPSPGKENFGPLIEPEFVFSGVGKPPGAENEPQKVPGTFCD